MSWSWWRSLTSASAWQRQWRWRRCWWHCWKSLCLATQGWLTTGINGGWFRTIARDKMPEKYSSHISKKYSPDDSTKYSPHISEKYSPDYSKKYSLIFQRNTLLINQRNTLSYLREIHSLLLCLATLGWFRTIARDKIPEKYSPHISTKIFVQSDPGKCSWYAVNDVSVLDGRRMWW